MGTFYPPKITTAERTALILNAGEIVFDEDENIFYAGDGLTLGGLTLKGPKGDIGDGVQDGGVTTVKLADNAVTTAKIAPSAITATELAADSVDGTKLVAGSVDASKSVIASQVEAETGTDTTKLMTPQRTAQAVAALGGGSGGAMVPIATRDLTGNTDFYIPFDRLFIDNDFDAYEFHLIGINHTNNNGSWVMDAYVSTAEGVYHNTNYSWANKVVNAATNAEFHSSHIESTVHSRLRFAGNEGDYVGNSVTDNDNAFNAVVRVVDPLNPIRYKGFSWDCWGVWGANLHRPNRVIGSGSWVGSTLPLVGIRFACNNGPAGFGYIKVYGINGA